MAQQTLNLSTAGDGLGDTLRGGGLKINAMFTELYGNVGNVYNVKDPDMAGGALGNGTTDDTAAIQTALYQAASAGGGTVVLPPGSYLVTAQLDVSAGVNLVGAGPLSSQIVIGDVLCGSDTGVPIIKLGETSAVRMLGIRTQTRPVINAGATTPVVHPWAIGVNGSSNATIEDVRLVSLWRGIGAGTTGAHEAMTVRRLTGFCLKEGIYIDQNTDVDRLEGVHLHPNYSLYYDPPGNFTTTELFAYVRNTSQLVGLRVRRADWIKAVNCFWYGCHRGLVAETGTATVSGRATASFAACGWDGCKYDLDLIDATTITFVGCTTASTELVGAEDNKNVRISAGSGSNFGFTACDFLGGVPDAQIDVTGAASVSVDNCKFFSHYQGIVASAGRLTVNNCTFNHTGGTLYDIALSGSATISGGGNRRYDGSAIVTNGVSSWTAISPSANAIAGMFDVGTEIIFEQRVRPLAGLFSETLAPAVLNNGVTTMYFVLPADQSYLVWGASSSSTGGYRCWAFVRSGTASCTVDAIGGGGLAVAASGLTVGFTNSSGGALLVSMGILRFFHG